MANLTRIRAIFSDHCWPLAVLVLLPILANAAALSGFFNNDPTLQFIGLGTGFQGGILSGQMDWLDPTVGYITQPVGHLVASDWAHGVIPWWNPYSGVGMPLAAEMQSAVFFLPFVLLLHWNCGWLVLKILLQILCGVFGYAFFVEINLRREAALLGGAHFSLSPLFFLSPHAAINPLPFLPLLLLGIEYAARASLEGKKLGWSLVTIATAYSILGGFPEITYLDGLLAGVWTLWRFSTLPTRVWLRFAGKLALGLTIALCLCAPLLIPFFEYLPHAYLGPHAGPLFNHNRIAATLAPQQIFPFLYGPLNAPVPVSLSAQYPGGFVRIPSWISLSILTLAIAALWRRGRLAQPRYVLALWIALWEARYAGFAPAEWVFNHVPGLATSDIIRFSGPMLAFSTFTLAAFAFDDYLFAGAMSKRRLLGVAGTVVVILGAVMAPVAHFLLSWWEQVPFDMYIGSLALILASLTALFLCRELLAPRFRLALLALLLAGPFYGMAYTQFAGFRGGHINQAPINYLRTNAGLERMVSLGPLDLNFPVRYGISSIDYAAMPTPLDWTKYVTENLYAHVDLSIYPGAAAGQRDFLLHHLENYEALGVRYVVTGPTDDLAAPPLPLAALQLRKTPVALLPNEGGFIDPKDGRYVTYGSLPNVGDFTGSISVALSSPEVKSVSVIMGTYRGSSRGIVWLTLCAAGQCATAQANPVGAVDNAPLTFEFPAPFTIPPGAALSYRFHHKTGTPVAIWLSTSIDQQEVPSFSFTGTDGKTDPGFVVNELSLVFRDSTASIYRLANTMAYAGAADGHCKIAILNRQEMHSSCSVPGSMIRRELYFAGWSASVNGADTPVSRAGLFQSINLPQGEADIKFAYAPPHSRLAFLLAIIGVLVWLGLVVINRPAAERGEAG